MNAINPYEPSQSGFEESPAVVEGNKESFSLILTGTRQWLWSFRIAFHTTLLFVGIAAVTLTYFLGDSKSGLKMFAMLAAIYALLQLVALVFHFFGLLNFCRVGLLKDIKFYFVWSLVLFLIYWATTIINIGIPILNDVSGASTPKNRADQSSAMFPLILHFFTNGAYIFYCITSFLGLKTIGSHLNNRSIQSSSLLALTLYVVATLLGLLIVVLLMFEVPKFSSSDFTPQDSFAWMISGLAFLCFIHYLIGLYFYSFTLKQIIFQLRAAEKPS